MRCSFRMVLSVAAIVSATVFSGCSTTSRLASRAYYLLPFTGEAPPADKDGSSRVRTGNLAFKMQITPTTVKLSDTRQLDVRIQLENISKRFVQLQFPTSQRIELLVRNEQGKIVTQWSEDRSFDPNVSYVGINPGEHVDYTTTISTRDLEAGKKYFILGFFPNFEELKAEQMIVPEA